LCSSLDITRGNEIKKNEIGDIVARMKQMKINVTRRWLIQYQREKAWVQSQASQCKIHGGKRITGKSSSPTVLPVYPVSIILPMLCTHALNIYNGLEWIELAEDRDRWRALVNAVMLLKKGCAAWSE